MTKKKLTFEDLKSLVIAGDREGICTVLSKLNEKQRAELAYPAGDLAEAIDRYWGPGGAKEDKIEDDPDGSVEELLAEMSKVKYADWRVPRWTACLMILALSERSVLEHPWKSSLGWLRTDLADMPERVLQILIDRKPKWLESWLKHEWKEEFPAVNSHVERGLIRAGLIKPEIDGGFFDRLCEDSMYSFAPDARLTDKFKTKGKAIERILDGDPQILQDEIWGVFEHDSMMMRYGVDSWGAKLVELANAGKLDRDRLLSSSLNAMSLPMMQLTLNGMGKFHELLMPTIDEREKLQIGYLQLLESPHSTVVGHALKSLDELLKAKKLDIAKFYSALPAIFHVEKKTQPSKAIKMAQKALKLAPEQESEAAAAIAAGLQHENPDIQEACAKFLANCKTLGDQALSLIQSSLDSVAATLQASMKDLVDGVSKDAGTTSPKSGAKKTQANSKSNSKSNPSKSTKAARSQAGIDASTISNWKKTAKKVPAPIRAASGLSAAMERIDTPDLNLAPVELHLIPRRQTQAEIRPVESVEELIELVATTIENVQDVVDLERIMDGISKFYLEKGKDFDKRTAPLKKRILKLAEKSSFRLLDRMKSIAFTDLLTTWLELAPSGLLDRSRALVQHASLVLA